MANSFKFTGLPDFESTSIKFIIRSITCIDVLLLISDMIRTAFVSIVHCDNVNSNYVIDQAIKTYRFIMFAR